MSTTPEASPVEYLTLRQVADLLGMTYNGVRDAVRCGRIPAVRLSRRIVRVRRADLDAAFRPVGDDR